MNEVGRERAANGRSSVFQDQHGRWQGYVSMGAGPDGRPVRRRVSAKTKTEVTRKVQRLEAERDSGRASLPGRRPTLNVFLTEWVDKRTALGARPKTLAGYRTDLGHIREAIGEIRVDRLTPSSIERVWKMMVDKQLVGSIAHVRRTLNAALNDAVRDNLLIRNPVQGTRAPKHTAPLIAPFTIVELQTFLAHTATRRNGVRWAIAAVLGFRQGEVLGLRWSDVNLDARTVTISRQLQRRTWQHGCSDQGACGTRGADCPARWGGGLVESPPKSAAGRRTVDLPSSIADQLAEHRRAQLAQRLAAPFWAEGDWVFTTPAGTPIDHRVDWVEFKSILMTAGLREVRLHDLRHSSATLLLEADTDLKTTGKILGHTSLAQTSAYTHVLADRQRAAVGRVQALLWGTAP